MLRIAPLPRGAGAPLSVHRGVRRRHRRRLTLRVVPRHRGQRVRRWVPGDVLRGGGVFWNASPHYLVCVKCMPDLSSLYLR